MKLNILNNRQQKTTKEVPKVFSAKSTLYADHVHGHKLPDM